MSTFGGTDRNLLFAGQVYLGRNGESSAEIGGWLADSGKDPQKENWQGVVTGSPGG
jgi:hypothetical protein